MRIAPPIILARAGEQNEGSIELTRGNPYASGSEFIETAGRSSSLFAGLSVLICEDEYLLAGDLARRFELGGARIIGPMATLAESLEKAALAETLGAAVLDIRLGKDLVVPVADILAARGVPFVFFSGYDDVLLPPRFNGARRLRKVDQLDRVTIAVLTERVIGCVDPGKAPAGYGNSEIAAILPRLRLMARLLVGEVEGDELVEKTLERAIAEVAQRWAHASTVRWLMSLLEEVWLRRQRHRYLH